MPDISINPLGLLLMTGHITSHFDSWRLGHSIVSIFRTYVTQ